MALQWATSSIEAGLGFLARQAIRAGWTPRNPALREALHVLRPYRQGSPDETIESVFERMVREVGRQEAVGDVDDIEEVESDGTGSNGWVADPELLSAVLHEGVALLRRDPDAKWREIRDRILAEAGSEKVVMFAQPIETVTALSRFLERETGTRPALIIGNQSEELRQAENRFVLEARRPPVPHLVPSRRGGLEPPGGQTPRARGCSLEPDGTRAAGGTRTSLHVQEEDPGRHGRGEGQSRGPRLPYRSRETHGFLAGMLVAPERFEALFSRVMALVAPEDFQGVSQERPLGRSDEEQARIPNSSPRASTAGGVSTRSSPGSRPKCVPSTLVLRHGRDRGFRAGAPPCRGRWKGIRRCDSNGSRARCRRRAKPRPRRDWREALRLRRLRGHAGHPKRRKRS